MSMVVIVWFLLVSVTHIRDVVDALRAIDAERWMSGSLPCSGEKFGQRLWWFEALPEVRRRLKQHEAVFAGCGDLRYCFDQVVHVCGVCRDGEHHHPGTDAEVFLV